MLTISNPLMEADFITSAQVAAHRNSPAWKEFYAKKAQWNNQNREPNNPIPQQPQKVSMNNSTQVHHTTSTPESSDQEDAVG